MKIIGLTGTSGAGKSTVCGYLAERGFRIIDADKVYRQLAVENKEMLDKLGEEFGDIFLNDGSIDRKKLGQIVFANKDKLKKLNEITHFYVKNEVNKIASDLKEQGFKYCVYDAPQLFESGGEKDCFKVIAVIAPMEDRINRIILRDNITREAALMRVNNQYRDEFFIENSDFIIDNSEEKNIEIQIDKIIRRIINE